MSLEVIILILVGILLLFAIFRAYIKRLIFILVLLVLAVCIYGFFNPNGKETLLALFSRGETVDTDVEQHGNDDIEKETAKERTSHHERTTKHISTSTTSDSETSVSTSSHKETSLSNTSKNSISRKNVGQSFSSLFFADSDAEITAIMQMMDIYIAHSSIPSEQDTDAQREAKEDTTQASAENHTSKQQTTTKQNTTKKTTGLTAEEIRYTQWLFGTISEEF
ncbi:hypothetical protein J5893_01665 [bacterium]|nr:hypothetical protein [bacterium]